MRPKQGYEARLSKRKAHSGQGIVTSLRSLGRFSRD